MWSPPVWQHVVLLSLLSETYLPPFSFALYFSQTVCQVALCAPYAHSTLQSWKDLYISQGFSRETEAQDLFLFFWLGGWMVDGWIQI